MKRILLISNSNNSGSGWGTVYENIQKNIPEKFEHETLTIPYLSGSRGEFIVLQFIIIFYFFKNLKKVKSCDVVILLCEPLLLFLYLSKFFKKKITTVLYGYGTFIYTPFVKSIKKYYNRLIFKKVDKFIVSSQYSKKKAEEWCKDTPVNVIHLGVNTSVYFPEHKKNDKQYFIYVGGLKERKGYTFLLKAFDRLVQKYNNLYLIMVCPVPGQRQMNKLRRYTDVSRIEFTGRIDSDELRRLYSGALANILVSRNMKYIFEGFGLIHLEANACGTLTIGGKNTANDDIIRHGYNGYLVEFGDENSLYKCMEEILQKPEIRKKMEMNAKNKTKNNLWDNTVKNLFYLIFSNEFYS